MCRIVGFWDLNYNGHYNLQKTLTLMRDTLIHGGPDDAGIYVEPEKGLALGHRRLSILDLSPLGYQPMEFDNLVILYNGEVYNFREIREELEKYGYTFKSETDTEVILKAFHKWRFEAVHKFRGMFAFAIWDRTNEQLILCRDRIGVKPLYWYYKDGLFIFGSELKAFLKHPKFRKILSEEALSLYFQYGYISAPYAVFENTYKLEPGYFLIFSKNREIKKIPYWDITEYYLKGIEDREKWLKRNEEELAEELESLLKESFKLRLVADVPVGMFLSGGIDSTTVATLLTSEGVKLKTFTIGFYEKDFNEAPHARKIAEYLGTEHYELYCTPKEALEIIPKLPEIYDEPFGDSSAIPTYLVSKLAKTQVKVSLSADGGDEQFCGYSRYWNIVPKINLLKKFSLLSSLFGIVPTNFLISFYKTLYRLRILPQYPNFRDKIEKLKETLKNKDIIEAYDTSLKYFLTLEIEKLGFQHFLEIKKIVKVPSKFLKDICLSLMYVDFKTYLPDDILVKVDRATMSVSLEGREPFLDHKLVEWTSQLPSTFKWKSGKGKYLLRKVLYKYIPKELVDRPKQGFRVPIYQWLKKDINNFYKELLFKKEDFNFINYSYARKLIKDFEKNRGVNSNKLWLLLIFQLWREKYNV